MGKRLDTRDTFNPVADALSLRPEDVAGVAKLTRSLNQGAAAPEAAATAPAPEEKPPPLEQAGPGATPPQPKEKRRASGRKVLSMTPKEGLSNDLLGKRASKAATARRSGRELRVVASAEQEQEFLEVVSALGGALRTRLAYANVLRSLMDLFIRAQEKLVLRAGETGVLPRPPHDNPVALAEYEANIADIIDAALDDARRERRHARRQEREASGQTLDPIAK